MATMGRALFSPFRAVLPHPCVCRQLPDSRSHSKAIFLKFERSSSKRNYVGFLCELISSISANSVLTNIPEKFVRSVGGHIPEVVKLETPDGNTHTVCVAKEQNNLVLRSGWEIFASVYELEEGDLLRFRYSGDSHFKVEIYDLSACEKESSCVVMNCNPCLQKRSIPHDSPMRSPGDEKLATRHNGSCSNSCKTSKTNPAGSPLRKPTEKDTPPSKVSQDPMDSGELRTTTRSCYVLAIGCNLTKAHKAEIDELEQKNKSEIPLYVKTMDRTSLVDGFLVICKDYASKYLLPYKDEIITLCHANHSKTLGVHFEIKTDDTYILSAGWLGFVEDNELQEGDTCLFEVLKSQRSFTMAVHVLKAGHYHPPGSAPSANSFRPEDNVRFTRFTTLEGLMKTKVYEKVEYIKSGIPIFMSIMLKTNLDGGRTSILSFSMDYARDYLLAAGPIIRLHRPGESKPWKAKYKIINNRCWLAGGWRRFTVENKLRLDDICLFEQMENRKKLRMMVHIIRKEEYC